MENNKWISVSEDLPEPGCRVLVFTNLGGLFVAYLNVYKEWKSGETSRLVENVIAWLPLPSTPNQTTTHE